MKCAPRLEIIMGEVVRLPKHDPQREKARLIQEARALYEFPTENGPANVLPCSATLIR